MSSVIARNRPIANENSTTDPAKTNVHANTERNGPRISGSLIIFPKLRKPTYVFHPGCSSASCCPGFPGATNDPRPLSRKTLPLARSTNVLFFGVVAQRRRELDGVRGPLRLDRAHAGRGHLELTQLLVELEQLCTLDQREPFAEVGTPTSLSVYSPFASGVRPFVVPM